MNNATVFSPGGRPLVFAHRGGSRLAPENTLLAFEQALSLGADGLELDVHLSSDGQVVVHHDRLLDRTTDQTGPVAARTAAALARCDAGYRFARDGQYPYRGHDRCGVPALRDVLAASGSAPIIIEMKVNDEELARTALDVVRAANALDRVCLGAFGGRCVKAARTLEPRVTTSAGREEVRWALYRSWVGLSPSRPRYRGFQVPEWAEATRVVSPRFVRAVHRAGLFVHVWTVDSAADACRLLDMGVDGIITDRPDVTVPAVREWIERRGK